MQYRPEIDGLRAFAVVPVILFHAGFDTFSGGFIGVDVFFVISGYLITTIILSDLHAGRFSILNFYERRVRRILPALFLVMASCIPFALMWLFKPDLKEFSQSIVAVSIFSSNILFLNESDYFDTAAELKPLLHTWSLAVEEQFYLIFPLLILLVWRYKEKHLLILLALITVISLSIAQYGALNIPTATFYLLPFRIWELTIGAFIAVYSFTRQQSKINHLVNQTLSTCGLAMIVLSVIVYNDSTPYPSLYTLLPTIGAGLIIIFTTPDTQVSKLLGSRALVGVGLISYSAYLWHQPLFAFARHRSFHEPNSLVFICLFILVFILAYLTWRYVERPFRNKSAINKDKVFKFAIVGSLSFVAIGLTIPYLQRQYPQMIPRGSLGELENRIRPNYGLSKSCRGHNLVEECRTSSQPEFALWGDSFAMHLMQGLQASDPGIKIVQITTSECGPVMDIAPLGKRPKEWAKKCIESNDRVLDYLKQSKTIKYVIVSSPFSQYVDDGAMVALRNGEIENGDAATLKYFQETLQVLKLAGITPIVVSPPPMSGQDIGRCLLKTSRFSEDLALCDFPLSEALSRQKKVFDLLSMIERNFKVIWLTDGICFEGICHASIDNVFLYRDSGHLSQEGSRYLGKSMQFSRFLSK